MLCDTIIKKAVIVDGTGAASFIADVAICQGRIQAIGQLDGYDAKHVNKLTMVGSDGLPNDPSPHPRLWGAFPRVLGQYCREEQLFSLEEAVHKMTGMSANRYKLKDRGEIKIGAFADLVLFDPDTIKDTATFQNPISIAKGIENVFVNGQLTYSNGNVSGKRKGVFLFRNNTHQNN
ncbi:N-acyl-D-aspartate/D-glutamate deacylase [Photobacterium sp. SKA34]|nr:N-acyl-D-aspartate/D-glutamate deacylase [Photobacterium sp. SKA34]